MSYLLLVKKPHAGSDACIEEILFVSGPRDTGDATIRFQLRALFGVFLCFFELLLPATTIPECSLLGT